MRKKFLCMLAMGVIAASLCACGGKDTEKSSAITPQIATGIPIDSTQENTDADAPIPTVIS